jgi:glutamate-1-semialdehyde aminotransferase
MNWHPRRPAEGQGTPPPLFPLHHRSPAACGPAGTILGLQPDIACYAKLLTAGVAPLAVTLASDEVYNAFSGPTKVGGAGWGLGV